MENGLFLFFVSAITALAVENALFFRVLGFDKYFYSLNSFKAGILYGGTFTVIAVLSSFPISFINYLLRGSNLTVYVRAPAYFVCVSLIFVAIYFTAMKKFPSIFDIIKDILPVSTFNTALFGALYVSAINSYTFPQTVGCALGAGLGYTAAITIVHYAKNRLSLSPVPASFRGLPILLLYVGILSLALYGLIGQSLPT